MKHNTTIKKPFKVVRVIDRTEIVKTERRGIKDELP